MNRQQRRRAEHAARVTKTKNPRVSFEQGLRRALKLAEIDLVSCVPGTESEAARDPKTGGEARPWLWVLTLRSKDRFITVRAPQASVADAASGVVAVVRRLESGETAAVHEAAPSEVIEAAAAPAPAPLSYGGASDDAWNALLPGAR